MTAESVAVLTGLAGAGGYGRLRYVRRPWRALAEPGGGDGDFYGTYVYLVRWPRRTVFARVAYDSYRNRLGSDELRDKDHDTALIEALARARSHCTTLNNARRLNRGA